MRRIINSYEYCKQRAYILSIENDSLRSGVNVLVRKDSLSQKRIRALKAKVETKAELHEEKTKIKDKKILTRNLIIIGEGLGIITLLIILF